MNITKGSAGGIAATRNTRKVNGIRHSTRPYLNVWEVLLNDVSIGKYDSPNNSVWAMDVFPLNQTAPNLSTFYMDNVNFNPTHFVQKALDVAVLGLNVNQKVLNHKIPCRWHHW